MLVVYGVPGSPGASTTAIHVAAHWASSGREVLLIEADSAGGSMSRNMGIQFTPGAASFVASGSPVRKGDLIDHSQDVLFTNLHVMPCPSNPSSTREIIESFAERAEELRDVSENDMAVVIDAGRIEPGPFTELWTASAAGVAVVARGDSGSSMSSLEGVAGVLAAGSGGNGSANGCVVTIGKPLWSPDDFSQKCGMGLCGTIEDSPETAVDMSVFLDKAKRKDKKWRSSLKTVAEQLLPLAAPEPSVRPRPSPAAAPATPVLQAVPQTPGPQPEVPAYQTPPAPQPEAPAYQAPASPQPEVPAAYQSQVSQPGVLAYQTQPAPPAPQPEVPAAYQTPLSPPQPEVPAAYQTPPASQLEALAYQTPPSPQPEVPAAYQTPLAPQPQPEAAQPYQPPASPPPQPHPAPTPQSEAPAYQHPSPPEAPAAYQAPPSAYPPAAPTPPYQAPTPQPGAPPYQAPAAPTGPGRPPTPSPAQAVAPPVQPLPIPAEPTPEPPDIPPSGSFRDLAARLHSPTASAKKAPSAGGISS